MTTNAKLTSLYESIGDANLWVRKELELAITGDWPSRFLENGLADALVLYLEGPTRINGIKSLVWTKSRVCESVQTLTFVINKTNGVYSNMIEKVADHTRMIYLGMNSSRRIYFEHMPDLLLNVEEEEVVAEELQNARCTRKKVGTRTTAYEIHAVEALSAGQLDGDEEKDEMRSELTKKSDTKCVACCSDNLAAPCFSATACASATDGKKKSCRGSSGVVFSFGGATVGAGASNTFEGVALTRGLVEQQKPPPQSLRATLALRLLLLFLCVLQTCCFVPGHNQFGFARRTRSQLLLNAAAMDQKQNPPSWNLFAKLFPNKLYQPGGNKLDFPGSKLYNITTGERVTIERFRYDAVDLEAPIQRAVKDIETVLSAVSANKAKGPVVVVRGVGGGKTRALTALYSSIKRQKENALPILITFNSDISTSDFKLFRKIVPAHLPTASDHVLALAVIVRIAAAYHHGQTKEAVNAIVCNAELVKQQLMEAPTTKLLEEYLEYLVRRTDNINSVVLLVDETLAAEREMAKLFPDFSASGYLRQALLGPTLESASPPMKGAIVFSSLCKFTDLIPFGKQVYPMELSEALNPDAVAARLFLVDMDSSGTKHKVVPVAAPNSGFSNEQCYAILSWVAQCFQDLPRAIELAQDEFRSRVLRSDDGLRTIEISAELIDKVFTGAIEQFKEKYRPLNFPAPRLLHALLSHHPVKMDQAVSTGIMQSIFTNVLNANALSGDVITLRSSIVPLYAAVKAERALPGSLVGCVCALFEMLPRWVEIGTSRAKKRQLGTLLQQLSIQWTMFKLIAAQESGLSEIALLDFLNLNPKFEIRSKTLTSSAYLMDHIGLPTEMTAIPIIQLNGSFYVPGTNQVDLSHFYRLNDIMLTDESPVVILKTVWGDCCDYIVAYLSRPDEQGARHKRALFLNTRARQEVHRKKKPVHRAKAPPAEHLAEAVKQIQGSDSNIWLGTGLGDSVARGDYLYVYQSTNDHGDVMDGNVLRLGRDTTKKFFGFMFNTYATFRACFNDKK